MEVNYSATYKYNYRLGIDTEELLTKHIKKFKTIYHTFKTDPWSEGKNIMGKKKSQQVLLGWDSRMVYFIADMILTLLYK